MVGEREIRDYPMAWSGLVSGSLAWAISTQLNYALVPWQCGNHAYPIPWIALVLAFSALIGAAISVVTWWGAGAGKGAVRLAAGVAALAAVLFAAVILLQATAALIFTGCER
jgi:hypothetical protein